MRIGIDARMYGHTQTGIGNYTKFLIKNLEHISGTKFPNVKFFVFLRKNGFKEFTKPNDNFVKVIADYKWYSFEEQIKFPVLLYKYKLDLMHFTHFNAPIFYYKPFIVTIHDLTQKFYSGRLIGKYWHRCVAYNLVLKNAIKKSKYIITPSQFTKNDILKNYKVNNNKIKVIYEGIEHISKSKERVKFKTKFVSQHIKSKQILNYVLYLGVIRPHKNLVNLVKAFAILKNKKTFVINKLKLILAGPDDGTYPELREKIKKHGLERDVIITGILTEKEKIQFLANARLVILPSLYEGFGLTPLEAISLGITVAVSDIEPLREILRESVFYFNPKNEKNMAKVIKQALFNKRKQKEKLKQGALLIKNYKWSKMAKEIFALYLKI